MASNPGERLQRGKPPLYGVIGCGVALISDISISQIRHLRCGHFIPLSGVLLTHPLVNDNPNEKHPAFLAIKALFLDNSILPLVQKNFGLFFTICSDIQQAAQLFIRTVISDNNELRINLSEIVMAHAMRRNVT